jgi:hypothetical protein
MKILDNCWDRISAADFDFGGHSIEGSTVKIYVRGGLDVAQDIGHLFCRRGANGFVGHCVLAFDGVNSFELVVNPFEKKEEQVVWGDPVALRYKGQSHGHATAFHLAGGLGELSAYVSISIEAQKFALHVLDESESALSA